MKVKKILKQLNKTVPLLKNFLSEEMQVKIVSSELDEDLNLIDIFITIKNRKRIKNSQMAKLCKIFFKEVFMLENSFEKEGFVLTNNHSFIKVEKTKKRTVFCWTFNPEYKKIKETKKGKKEKKEALEKVVQKKENERVKKVKIICAILDRIKMDNINIAHTELKEDNKILVVSEKKNSIFTSSILKRELFDILNISFYEKLKEITEGKLFNGSINVIKENKHDFVFEIDELFLIDETNEDTREILIEKEELLEKTVIQEKEEVKKQKSKLHEVFADIAGKESFNLFNVKTKPSIEKDNLIVFDIEINEDTRQLEENELILKIEEDLIFTVGKAMMMSDKINAFEFGVGFGGRINLLNKEKVEVYLYSSKK